MPHTVRIGPQPATAQQGKSLVARASSNTSFDHVMAAQESRPTQATGATHTAHARHGHHHHHAALAAHASLQQVAPAHHHRWVEKPATVIPADVQLALKQAMHLEKVPDSWHEGLQFIVAQESGGRVDTQSRVDTARGLFQLTHASYHMNPNGAASFGNALEEAQGGIRYIRERYGTAENAASFWRRRLWY